MRNIAICIMFIFYVTSTQAMMAGKPTQEPTQPGAVVHESATTQAKTPRDKTIYFLSYDGKYLRTTAGTLYAPVIKIVNHGATDPRQLKDAERAKVKFTVVNRVITQADIYP